MKTKTALFAAAILILFPASALAQGVVRGAVEGTHDGERTAGPVGAVVGGVVGAVVGGVDGLFGIDQRPRFRDYVIREHRHSYRYDHVVAVGSELPDSGITYYDVPSEYGVHDYRYTVVNDRTVLVDPRTHRVVDVIN
ncbi:MAG: DUF1236 domain-containing protein [Ancalomicrobiaceae bacterium]|nr:DUF1236 domain-containing protein [Ancalomicrobiaceae bacterium]